MRTYNQILAKFMVTQTKLRFITDCYIICISNLLTKTMHITSEKYPA